ncbi:MAG: PAS domain S-box protein [Methylomonas sp.]|jgi:PAS domain S-box-containing protein
MSHQNNIKRIFSTIFGILALICLAYVALLWNGLNNVEHEQQELIRRQHSVFLIQDIRCHAEQIQRILTDIGATRNQHGFADAAAHKQEVLKDLDELAQISPALFRRDQEIRTQIAATYDSGVKMAWDYINQGMEAGNAAMAQLNGDSDALNADLRKLSAQLDAELREGLANNTETLYLNRVILLGSAPIVIGLFSIFGGKTSRLLRQKMDDLANRTTQLNTILNSAASAIITINKTGEIVSFNYAAERIFGYNLAEVQDKNIKMLMPENHAAMHEGHVRNFNPGRQDVEVMGRRRELEGKRKNGELFPILLRINPMEIEGELFFTGIIDDISETKTLQIQLGQAQKLEAIGQLASGIAHEINTPIQYIGDNLSALEDNFKDIIRFRRDLTALGDPDFQRQVIGLAEKHDLDYILEDSPKAIKHATEGVEKVAKIVKAMKTFSHLDSGQTTSTLDLHEALRSALTISHNTYKFLADVETDFAADVGHIECYASELNQVFLNMIINASHAIEEKQAGRGLIRIATHKLNENRVEILIADNGAGIPAAIQEKVFNLFFTTKPVGKGTGQGLSLAHNIVVEKHRGGLFFESTPGVGTTFHIQLPVSQAAS